jgi:hypothetical protein
MAANVNDNLGLEEKVDLKIQPFNNIRFIEITPDSGALGILEVYFRSSPGGLNFSREHERPVFPRRTQDGSLITQTLRYNKKTISISGVLFEITIHDYLEELFESVIGATLKLLYENSSYEETEEFNKSVNFISYADDMDEIANLRNIRAVFMEV